LHSPSPSSPGYFFYKNGPRQNIITKPAAGLRSSWSQALARLSFTIFNRMHKIILASQSPRRKQLMEAAELDFEIVIADVDETNPPGMAGELVPEFLAKKKAAAI